MSNIPTAEEYVKQYPYIDSFLSSAQGYEVLTTFMKEFAKLHVEAALKAASENAKTEYIEPDGCATGDYYDINKDSILNSYSIENIK